jgi:general secretion pathway protein D
VRPARRQNRTRRRLKAGLLSRVRFFAAALLLAIFPVSAGAQTASQPAQAAPAPPGNQVANQASNSASQGSGSGDAQPPTASEKRRAVKLYLAASKLFVNGQFEAAMRGYAQAAKLDPTNSDYRLSVEVARSHAVTALIQSAAKARLLGDEASARADLSHALELDPRNIEATQHLYELAGDAVRGQPQSPYAQAAGTIGGLVQLETAAGLHSFHLRTDRIQAIHQVFQAYGVTAMLDDSVSNLSVRLDMDDASFDEATRILGMVTGTFYVPLDPHHALVARDTRDLRERYTRQGMETLYAPGLSDAELTDVQNLARNVFGAAQAVKDSATSSITLRATPSTLAAFNDTMRTLLDGRNQVLLDVKMIQVAHNSTRNTGVQPPQTITAFNVYAEEQSILSQNAALVQQIISSGLASPGDTLAILGILIASGQVSSSLFSNGIALFGGGLTASGLSPTPATFNLNLNSSDSRALDDIQLRLGDGEAGTLKEGERYPIQTSSYSSLSSSLPNIPGLTGAGSSSSLSALASSLGGTVPNIPMVQYQDLGLSLKATPKVMRGNDVALTIDMSLNALSGSSIDGNPILNNQAYSGVVTLKEGEATVIAAELSRSQSMAISGTPGISEIPGLNNATSKNGQLNYATLLIVITPHVVRGTQAAGHTPMMLVDKVTQ